MAYGKYGHGTGGYGYAPEQPKPAEQQTPPTHAKLLRDAIDRLVRGSTRDDPNDRAIEDGPVPGSATAQD